MKKSIVLLTLVCGSMSAFAQKSKVRDARDYLSDNNYKKAIPVINEAVANEETKNNADAWFLRGMAYLQKALDTTAKDPQAADESYSSLMKALSIKPDYGAEINNALYSNALITFNEGVAGYGRKDYSSAYDHFVKVATIYNAAGRRFAGDRGFTDLVASAKTNAAYSALNAKRDADALTLFNDLKNTSAAGDSNIHQAIIEINQRLNNDAGTLTAINDARAKFPNNQTFRNLELNYYIKAGKQDVLLAKLEDAAKADPNNAEILFNLGNAYQRAAFPQDAAGKDMAKPANYNELFGKAEDYYKRAAAANPANPDYNYNLGVLYYGVAAAINKSMNDIKGMSPAEQKQYDALLKERNDWFDKALIPFEAAYANLDARSGSLSHDEKLTYQKTMIGLREIYSRKNDKAKTDELKKKLDALKLAHSCEIDSYVHPAGSEPFLRDDVFFRR
jgi:hypothetical protein